MPKKKAGSQVSSQQKCSNCDKQMPCAYGQKRQKTFPRCWQPVSQGQAANYPDEIETMMSLKGDETTHSVPEHS
jgi:hypothetical protein